MKKVALVLAVVLVGAVATGAAFKAGEEFPNEKMVEKIVKAVGAFYKGCEHDKASVIMAELAIVDVSKKKDKDAIPYLEKAIEGLEDKGLRNFTKFLIANSYKEKGETDKACEVLMTVINEK